uniref:F-box domain-containing protein n=1 Tax=Macrostomum lignano TaxID=282301 RepID=A0A1I8F9F8_9PLAT
MISRAYQHYNRKSFRRHFDSWLQFHLYRRRRLVEKRRILAKADGHFFQTKVGQIFGTWLEWTRFRKGRQATRVLHVSVVRVMFKAWHGVSLEARKTREYFERLERGDNVTEDEVLSKSTGEARDDLSLVSDPSASSLRHLSLADMSRAACVCRAWKAHTQSSELLHKLDFGQVRQHLTGRVAKKFLAQSRPDARPPQPGRLAGTFRWRSSSASAPAANLQDPHTMPLARLSRAVRCLIYVNLCRSPASRTTASRLWPSTAENVRFLSLASCQQLSDRGLQFPGLRDRVCHKLELLDLSEGEVASHLPFSGALRAVRLLQPHRRQAFRAISNRSLRVLKLDKNDIITDAAFGHLGRRCPELHQLCVADCVRVTDQALKAIGQLRYISRAELGRLRRLSDAGARASPRRRSPVAARAQPHQRRPPHRPRTCPHRGMNDSAMSVLGSLSRMRYLYLANCPQKLVAAAALPLEHLDLSHCVQLHDGGVRSMSFSCRLLTKLSACGAAGSSLTLSMQYVSGVCHYHYLTTLDLSECVMINRQIAEVFEEGVQKIAEPAIGTAARESPSLGDSHDTTTDSGARDLTRHRIRWDPGP